MDCSLPVGLPFNTNVRMPSAFRNCWGLSTSDSQYNGFSIQRIVLHGPKPYFRRNMLIMPPNLICHREYVPPRILCVRRDGRHARVVLNTALHKHQSCTCHPQQSIYEQTRHTKKTTNTYLYQPIETHRPPKPLFIFSEYRQKWWFPGQTPHVCIFLVPRPLGRLGF